DVVRARALRAAHVPHAAVEIYVLAILEERRGNVIEALGNMPREGVDYFHLGRWAAYNPDAATTKLRQAVRIARDTHPGTKRAFRHDGDRAAREHRGRDGRRRIAGKHDAVIASDSIQGLAAMLAPCTGRASERHGQDRAAMSLVVGRAYPQQGLAANHFSRRMVGHKSNIKGALLDLRDQVYRGFADDRHLDARVRT